MRIYMRLCELCYMDGKQRKAVGYYDTVTERHDACKTHLAYARQEGYTVFKLDDNEIYMEIQSHATRT